jgi:pyridoxal/pyridoxine/pyridoxamine kinase
MSQLCDPPCEHLVDVIARVEAIETRVETALKDELRRQHARTTKMVTSITSVALAIITALTQYQMSVTGDRAAAVELRETAQGKQLQETITAAVKAAMKDTDEK